MTDLLPHGQAACLEAQQNLTLAGDYTGVRYRHRKTGVVWSIAIEMGGEVWIVTEHAEMTCSLRDLEADDWERVE